MKMFRPLALLTLPAIALITAACAGGEEAPAFVLADDDLPRVERVQAALETLAHDSMMGREAGTEGELRAVRFLESELERYGVTPAGTQGYRQPVYFVAVDTERGTAWRPLAAEANPDTVPADRLRTAYNVLGIIPGTDSILSSEIVVVGAHHDHVGVGTPVDGDSIYNGADDDASGSVATLEIAREFAKRSRNGNGPLRTVVIAFFTAEEKGMV